MAPQPYGYERPSRELCPPRPQAGPGGQHFLLLTERIGWSGWHPVRRISLRCRDCPLRIEEP